MVADHFEPMELFRGKPPPLTLTLSHAGRGNALLLEQPCIEIRVHPLGERHQFVVLVDGEADEGDEIGQDSLAARAFDFRLLQCGIGLPELRFVPQVGRFFDGVGQFLDVFKC